MQPRRRYSQGMTDDARALLARIDAEEQELTFTRFGLSEAWALGTQLRDAAVLAALPIVIGITLGEARVFHTALPGSSSDNDAWLERKTRVARRYGRSSYGVGQSFRVNGRDFDTSSRLDTGLYAAHGGVFPLTIEGVGAVGTVGVSGLPQADDHAFVVEQLRAFRLSLDVD